MIALSKHILHLFLFHASIARPMGESAKLKLTTDMTELEVGLASFLMTGSVSGLRGERSERAGGAKLDNVGEEYHALRAFR